MATSLPFALTSAPEIKAHKDYHLADGTKVPSVTQIIENIGWKSHGLMWWGYHLGLKGVDLKTYRAELADAGKLTHKMCEHDMRGLSEPDVTGLDEKLVAKARGSFQGYLRWKESMKLDIVSGEMAMVSEAHRYGGRPDAVGSLFGEPVMIDYKSSKDLYPEVIIQVAAYDRLWTENKDMPCTRHMVLRWNPEGRFVLHDLSEADLEAGWRGFLAAKQLHEIKRELRK
jgi:hypothetical protein